MLGNEEVESQLSILELLEQMLGVAQLLVI
jgi:hypothetical protein